MTLSNYMPDVFVEIAFNSTFTTPEGSRVWTDVSQWVELSQGINITYGRSDERSQADANTMSLTLDNRDGRFTPERPASPYYPNVRLYRPIRVRSTPPGGTGSIRFSGYINQWPTEWNGTDAYAMANLTAASRMARLSLSPPRTSLVEEAMLRDSPRALYTLTEPEGSLVASDSSGKGSPALTLAGPTTPAIQFAGGTGPSGTTAPLFTNGQSLALTSNYAGSPEASFECWFQVDAPPAAQSSIFFAGEPEVGATFVNIRVETNGRAGILYSTGAGSTDGEVTTTSVADGILHHLAVTITTTELIVYIDGLLVFSLPTAASVHLASPIDIGGSRYLGGSVPRFPGVISHVGLYDYALSTTLVNVHYAAGTSGYDNESSTVRLGRYAEYANIPIAEFVTPVVFKYRHVSVPTDGQGILDLIRQVEVTESAVLYDRRDGRLAMVPESVRYTATPAFTLDMASQQVEADFSPQLDPSTIVNDSTVTRLGSSLSARVIDESSRDEFGLSSGSIEVTSNNDDHPLNLASWQLYRYAEPKTRVPSITVDVAAQVGGTPSPDALFAADIHTMIRVTNLPSQANASTADYFVEGCSETIGLESYFISFNVSPAEPFTKVFILDDPVRGVLDGSYVLGL